MEKRYVIMLDGERFYSGVTDWRVGWCEVEQYGFKYGDMNNAKKELKFVQDRAYDCVGEKIEPSRIAIYEVNYRKIEE